MDNKITLFVNKDATPENKKPYYKGYLTVNGAQQEFACWPAKNGKPDVYTGTWREKKIFNPPAFLNDKVQSDPNDSGDDSICF